MELQEAGDHLCRWRAAIFRGCRRAQAASQRERSALSISLPPTGKDCAELLEHEFFRILTGLGPNHVPKEMKMSTFALLTKSPEPHAGGQEDGRDRPRFIVVHRRVPAKQDRRTSHSEGADKFHRIFK